MFDGSQLTETIVASTLPAAVSDQSVLHGVVSLEVSNNSGVAQKFKGAVGIFIANGALDIPSKNWSILRSQTSLISLADGKSKTFKFPISIAKGKLGDGTDTLYGVVTDQNSVYSQSPAGPTLTVHVPINSLSETEKFSNLPASVALAAKLHAVDHVTISNSGSDPFAGSLTVNVLGAPHGSVSTATTIISLTRKLTIPAGRSVTLGIPLRSSSALGAGTYDIVAQVIQPNGTQTNSNPSAGPAFTVQAPITAPNFSDMILTASETYAPDAHNSIGHHITQLDLFMSIQNYGTTSNGKDLFTLFASTKPTLDSSAIQESSLPLNLYIGSEQDYPLQLDINIPDNGPDNGTPVNYYIFVQVTDTAGGISEASYATPISFAGPISG